MADSPSKVLAARDVPLTMRLARPPQGVMHGDQRVGTEDDGSFNVGTSLVNTSQPPRNPGHTLTDVTNRKNPFHQIFLPSSRVLVGVSEANSQIPLLRPWVTLASIRKVK